MRKSTSAPCLTKGVFPQDGSSALTAACNEGSPVGNSFHHRRLVSPLTHHPSPPLRRGTSLPCISAVAAAPSGSIISSLPSMPSSSAHTAFEFVRYVPVTRVAACSMSGALGESQDDQDMAACLATTPDIHCDEEKHEPDHSAFPWQRRRAWWMHKRRTGTRRPW